MSTKAYIFQRACRAHMITAEVRRSKLLEVITTPQQCASHSTSGGQGSSGKPRRAITVTSDDGRYAWSNLSAREKASRSTQQSYNFLIVTAGLFGTVTVAYLLYTELFATDSKTRQFNRAVDRIKADAQCRQLLGPANQIIAFGEPTSNKWARARPLAHTVTIDQNGTTHLKMHFNVEGADGRGQVQVHMTKRQDQQELEYQLLSLTVPGHQTVYLENADAKPGKKNLTKMFGVQWGR